MSSLQQVCLMDFKRYNNSYINVVEDNKKENNGHIRDER
jgi:hypothetical protein